MYFRQQVIKNTEEIYVTAPDITTFRFCTIKYTYMTLYETLSRMLGDKRVKTISTRPTKQTYVYHSSLILLGLQNHSQGPVVQRVFSLTSWLRVISLTVLEDSMYNILIFFSAHFFSKKFQHICTSLNLNFNKLLTNDIVSFEQLGHGHIK